MTNIRITAGLLGFEKENCASCEAVCGLERSAENLGVNAEELRTIGKGICPYHPQQDVIPRERHEKDVLDYSRPHVRDGVTLVQRIVRKLSGVK